MQKKIRVLLVISNLEFGGAQRQLVELANNLSDDFHVVVCTLSDYMPLREYLCLSDDDVVVIKKRSKYDLTVPFRLAIEARKRKIDVIHAYLFDAEIAARVGGLLACTPIVIGSERNSDYRIKKNQMLAYRLTKNLRHHCIANSRRGAEFNSDALSYPMSHYSVVLNGVDTARFSTGKAHDVRQSLDIPEDLFVIGIFASFKKQKNHPMLLHALKMLQENKVEFRALFVGDKLHGGAQNTSVYFEKIVDLGAKIGIDEDCVYLGNVQNVQQYYRACDVTVLPSRFEGTPNAVLESFACGVPVIVTDVSSNDEIVEEGHNGYIVALDDVDALYRRLAEIADDSGLRLRLGEGARDTAERKFASKMLAENTAAVYRKLVQGPVHRSRS